MLQGTVIPQVRFSSFWSNLVYWFREKKPHSQDTQPLAVHSKLSYEQVL